MINHQKPKGQWAGEVDKAVAKFTKDILNVANQAGVDFRTVGALDSREREIHQVMDVNVKAVDDLLKL